MSIYKMANKDGVLSLQPKLAHEYITTRISLRDLAAKYDLKYNTVADMCKEHNWRGERISYYEQLTKQTLKDTAKGISQKVTTINTRHFKTWDKMLTLVNKILDDEAQIMYSDTKQYKLGKIEVIAKIMLMVQQGQRQAKGMGDVIELKKLDIAMKRLELEAKKIAGTAEEELPDDGFIAALSNEADNVWGVVANGDEDT